MIDGRFRNVPHLSTSFQLSVGLLIALGYGLVVRVLLFEPWMMQGSLSKQHNPSADSVDRHVSKCLKHSVAKKFLMIDKSVQAVVKAKGGYYEESQI